MLLYAGELNFIIHVLILKKFLKIILIGVTLYVGIDVLYGLEK